MYSFQNSFTLKINLDNVNCSDLEIFFEALSHQSITCFKMSFTSVTPLIEFSTKDIPPFKELESDPEDDLQGLKKFVKFDPWEVYYHKLSDCYVFYKLLPEFSIIHNLELTLEEKVQIKDDEIPPCLKYLTSEFSIHRLVVQ